jgi:hypothetical protein
VTCTTSMPKARNTDRLSSWMRKKKKNCKGRRGGEAEGGKG